MPIIKEKIVFYFLAGIGTLSLIAGLVYRLYRIDIFSIVLIIGLSALVLLIISRKKLKSNKNNKEKSNEAYPEKSGKISGGYLAAYLAIWAGAALALYSSRTDTAIISPWEMLSGWFWALYIILTVILILSAYKSKYFELQIILHCLLSFGIAACVYRLGFGFDTFVHQATLELILEQGYVEPKPFYYLGQYGLLAVLAGLGLPLAWLNTWLVPGLAALTLPANLALSLDEIFSGRRLNRYLMILVLLLPFSIFTLTTPQNLAWLFLLHIIIISLRRLEKPELILMSILALSALITQPIAGIPAVLFVGMIIADRSDMLFRRSFKRMILLLVAASLPSSFLLLARLGGPEVSLGSPGLAMTGISGISFPDQEGLLLNWLYFFGQNLAWLAVLAVGAGWLIARKNRRQCRAFGHSLLVGFSLLVSYFITRSLEFSFLIEYERDDFGRRILISAMLFFLPAIWLALRKLLDWLDRSRLPLRLAWMLVFCLSLTASLYFSYPRLDNYHNSRGYSVSASDIKAVRWIESDAQGSYAVLANQQVSAAALKEFGFKHYYPSPEGPVFYYAIPTGGPLYRIYLEMVYDEASRENALKAARLTGAETVYFVLNKYWWASPKIHKEAEFQADRTNIIDNGEVMVFKYSNR